MFTKSAGPKALLTVIRQLLEEDTIGLEAALVLAEVNGLWTGGSGDLCSLTLKDSLRTVIDDYETKNISTYVRIAKP